MKGPRDFVRYNGEFFKKTCSLKQGSTAYASHEARCKLAIHSMNSIFDNETTGTQLLIDVGNSYNSDNGEAIIHNINVICTAIAIFVSIYYSSSHKLFVIGGCDQSAYSNYYRNNALQTE